MSKKRKELVQRMEREIGNLGSRMDALERRDTDWAAAVQPDWDALARVARRAVRRELAARRRMCAPLQAAALGGVLAGLSAAVLITVAVQVSAAETVREDAQVGDLRAVEVLRDVPPVEAPETAENELIEAALLARAHLIESCVVTHYDCCIRCCGKDSGITASGVRAVPYVTVAVDPAVIPLESDVLVDYGDGEIHYYRACDTGRGVQGDQIDLCVASHQEAIELGRREAKVYWVEAEI